MHGLPLRFELQANLHLPGNGEGTAVRRRSKALGPRHAAHGLRTGQRKLRDRNRQATSRRPGMAHRMCQERRSIPSGGIPLLLALNQAKHPDELRTLLEELNLWRSRQSNQHPAQAIDTLVELKVRSETECPALALESTLGEVIEMFDQQSQCFIEYFKREHGREERIKGMWAGRKHGRRLAHEAGRQEGRKEGREEGREEGMAAGCQRTCLEMVRQILELRKVQLSNTATDRLEHADLPQLKTWLAQLLSNELPAELQN